MHHSEKIYRKFCTYSEEGLLKVSEMPLPAPTGIAWRCHVGSKNKTKKPSVADQKECAYTHIRAHKVSWLSQQSLLVWMATAAFNNYCPVSLLAGGSSVSAIWVLFAIGQGPGQAAQYTTVFGAGEEKDGGEKATSIGAPCVLTNLQQDTRMYVLVVQMLHMYVHVCVIGVSSLLSRSKLKKLHHCSNSFFFSLLLSTLGPLGIILHPLQEVFA